MSRKLNGMNDAMGSLQWLVFMLANAVALPIVIGQIYHMSPTETAMLMQRTFIIVGVSSFLQGWLGHRLPIIDGPAGTWLAVFIIMGESVTKASEGIGTLRLLEGGMIAAGLFMIMLGATGLVKRLLPIFTPLVTGSYLLLLAFQLSGTFLRGMLGISGESQQAQWGAGFIGLLVIAIVILLSIKGKGWLQSYALLIGIVAGCLLYYATGQGHLAAGQGAWFSLPELFAWGMPQWDAGMIVSALPVTLILLSNTVASISSMKQLDNGSALPGGTEMKRGTITGGFSQLLSSVFSTVGMVPLSGSAGFVSLTGQRGKRPFLLACLLLAAVSLSPAIITLLTMLPGAVAYAAVMASFVQMVGIGFQTLMRDPLTKRRMMIAGIGLMLGIGSMFLPVATFQSLPSAIRYIVGNGMLLGTMIIIILDQIWKEPKEA
ncbi:purine/pyrimidine permease [Paenibacillus sp. GXUN7292]|uniref:purine/pyrimidine permease n=1 Tax=Paenibacillus sp. GXUN7292 TaxID=3422499 RepID=UPI003D7DFAD4